MNRKLALIVVAGLLPFMARGEDPDATSSASQQEPETLQLKLICRSGAVVHLDKAGFLERGVRKEGAIPDDGTHDPSTSIIRLDVQDEGTVSIPWHAIDKIAVGERAETEKTYPLEVTLKDVAQTKSGKSYGNDNTLVGQTDAGEFSIQLKDVEVIVVVSAPEPE